MTARALRGLEAIRDTAIQPELIPAIPFVTIDGLPRTGLSVKEIAKITGHRENRIRTEIRNGRLKADGDGQSYVIPVSELATIAGWAEHHDPTCP
jgi:hypothetical protein